MNRIEAEINEVAISLARGPRILFPVVYLYGTFSHRPILAEGTYLHVNPLEELPQRKYWPVAEFGVVIYDVPNGQALCFHGLFDSAE